MRVLGKVGYVVVVSVVCISIVLLSYPGLTESRHPASWYWGPFEVNMTGELTFIAFGIELAVLLGLARYHVGNRYVNLGLITALCTLMVALLVQFAMPAAHFFIR